jgi:hypothetical protein
MKNWFLWMMLLSLILLASSTPNRSVALKSQYTEFWIWGGIDPSRSFTQGKQFYVLQGFISEKQQKIIFTRQGMQAASEFGPVILVYRLNTLAWNRMIHDTLLNHIQAWEYRGNTVLGIQLDFDARTNNLDQYAGFLRKVRQDLPESYNLSITGLLDWASLGDPAVLESLQGIVDEIIFQTYQGKHTIPNYSVYLKSLAKLRFPFKIGLVENGEWDTRYEQALSQSSYYRGAVMFLLPERL